MAKKALFFTAPESAELLKSHVSSYTRKDGTFVGEHDDKRASKPKDIGAGSWNVGHKVKLHAPGHALHGRSGEITGPGHERGFVNVRGEDGKSHSLNMHDIRPADGHGWPDLETGKQPAREASSGKPAALHHSDLKEGDELVDANGQKHEYSHTTRGLGRMKIETRAGYSFPTEKDGSLPGWKKTGRNNYR